MSKVDAKPFCWKPGGRVHTLDGNRCVCLMPAADLTNVAADFPFGFGFKECESCRTLMNSQRRRAFAAGKRAKPKSQKKLFKQYTKRLERQVHQQNIKDGFKPMPQQVCADFFASQAWKQLRYGALKKSNGRCELCGAVPSADIVLHVDHIKPRSKFPKLALDPNNLQVLCEPCNIGKSNHDTTDWRK